MVFVRLTYLKVHALIVSWCAPSFDRQALGVTVVRNVGHIEKIVRPRPRFVPKILLDVRRKFIRFFFIKKNCSP